MLSMREVALLLLHFLSYFTVVRRVGSDLAAAFLCHDRLAGENRV